MQVKRLGVKIGKAQRIYIHTLCSQLYALKQEVDVANSRLLAWKVVVFRLAKTQNLSRAPNSLEIRSLEITRNDVVVVGSVYSTAAGSLKEIYSSNRVKGHQSIALTSDLYNQPSSFTALLKPPTLEQELVLPLQATILQPLIQLITSSSNRTTITE